VKGTFRDGLKIVFLSILISLISLSCSNPDGPWTVDFEYTHDLTSTASTYMAITGRRSYEYVDVIQIYRTDVKEDEVFGLNSLRRKEFFLESRDKDFIDDFLMKVQSNVMDSLEGCKLPGPEEKVLHILAFDTTLLRVGYFRYYECPVNDRTYGIIRVPDYDLTDTIYYSAELPEYFRTLL
jgi:hypothetical protein